ncbi:hypothetical protein ACFQ0X_04275 [Streptomyces rectiviolaceus]|uniref:hypothetical protein n=1 Tax=Streptomyces rectiviolaceus TaxID=332591 RepID=UPI003641CE6E
MKYTRITALAAIGVAATLSHRLWRRRLREELVLQGLLVLVFFVLGRWLEVGGRLGL